VIELIKEDEIQDAGLIFKNIILKSEAHLERRETELFTPGDITPLF
jgi:hypothetical protein